MQRHKAHGKSASHATQRTAATIEISIRTLPQLFDSLDPAPLRERALDHAVERYILSAASEHVPSEPLRLSILLPESLRVHAADAAIGIHEHFRLAHAQGERLYRRRLRIGAFALVAGLVILVLSVALRSLLRQVAERGLADAFAEGLLIIGWVAMWRPIDILLYEHWESHLDHAMLDRLARIPVDYSFVPDVASPA